MAEVVIIIKDYEDGSGRVDIKACPSFADVCQMISSGHTPTSAHTYGMRMLRSAMELNRENDPDKHKVLIPRLT